MKRLRRYRRPSAIMLAGLQLIASFVPLSSYALTGGPSVPEVQQFSPVENTELVNLFTGDFSYQIPLMDVGGYPLTLSYSSNVGMESEASMVGLGWNINTGSISRDVRGLPDDFNGEKIKMTRSANPDETISAGVGLDAEITGYEINQTRSNGTVNRDGNKGSIGLGAELEISYNNYSGWSAGFSGGLKLKGSSKGDFKSNAGLGLGVTADSEKGSGINTSANIGYAHKIDEDEGLRGGFSYGLDVSSRAGIKKHSFEPEIAYENASVFGEKGGYGLKGLGVKNGEFGGGGKFSIGYSSPSMSPTIDWPMYTDGFSGDLKVGGEIGGVLSLSGDLKFAYENKRYAKNFDEVPAFGYMYTHNSTGGREVVDVLREKGNSVSKEIPNLPMAQFTHDAFQVNVQGMQTTFRAFRGDVGILHDPFVNEVSCKGGVGVEVNVGDLVKVGANIRVPVEYGQSGKWVDGNQFNNAFSFKKQIADNPLYEAVYFKSMGEATAMANKQLFETIGGFAAVTPTVDEHGNTSEKLFDINRTVVSDNRASFIRNNREFRQNNFQWLTIRDAATMGFNRQISNYPVNTFLQYGSSASLYESRVAKQSRNLKGISQDQISEVSVTRTDGTRFVFSIPAYNHFSSDVSFCIAGNTKDSKNGLVPYTPEADNSIRNLRGDNHLYDKEITPAHAYAWMLTEMLSADYVDLTGNGPSPDDLGTYTKFNYTRTDSLYRWRIPVQRDSAIFKEGVKSDPNDDMASYSYGAKELWYVHSIETKNYIAEFTYSDRDDAVGVLGENGGLDTRKRMKKLDKIELYTKSSRLEPNATPIKAVHFVYDYSLCKKVPNNINGEGKLTLKRIWFQYGSSEKGSRNPYLFSYSGTNPNYNSKKIDRWGNYIDADGESSMKTYAALPKATADTFASAWLLTRITMPTGAVMNIQYETNDYAYVQNMIAMEMMQVVGFTNVTGKRNAHALEGEDPVTKLYEANNTVNNYVQFKLKKPVSSDEEVTPYINNLRELYFSMNVRMSHGDSVRREVYEKAEGFITLYLNEPGYDYGVCDDHNFGWIRLPQIHNGDRMIDQNSSRSDLDYADGVHPISKSAWETIRKKYMHLVYNEEPNPGDPTQLGTALENCFNTMGEIFTQANLYLRNGKHANTAKLKGAKIRLNSPDLIKFGGGARVKKITISDEWGNMVQDPSLNFSYGKTYEYTTTSGSDTISSGVAQYEPAAGNEENPFVVPYRYVSEKPLSVDFNLYQTGPVGQIYFPAPVIGYSRVTVKDIQPVGAPATGFAVNEFYTAKDFPTLVSTTQMHIRSREIQVPPFYSEEHLNATQGFSVELNDMHGKQKAIYSYAPDGTNPISGTLYNYNTNPANTSQLSNEVQTINASTGNIQTELVGVDYDFFADARENQQHSMLPEVGVNVDISVRGVPVVIPSVYPGYTHFFGRLRAATFNKVIYRCGLLEETIAFDNGAQIRTHHLLRDRESGEVVLQDVENEFGDKQYHLTYPARWLAANSGMNGAYRNVGVQVNQLNVTDGTATLTNADKYFTQGDEVVCISRDAGIQRSTDGTTYGSTDTFTTAWVMNVDEGRYVRLINRAGSKLRSGVYDIRVIRSGYRNIINVPTGKFSLTASPVVGNRLVVPENNVLSAEATEFSNHWQTYGLFESAPPVYSCSCTHNQITKRNAIDLLGELVNKLLTSGDYKRRGINLNSAYSSGVAIFTGRFSGSIVYNGGLSGSMSRGNVVGYNSTNPEQQCELDIRMQDGTTFFPDSILAFTIDSRSFDDGDGDCNDIYTATGTITYLGAPVVSQSLTSGITRTRLTARVTITSCVPLANCQTAPLGRGEVRCLASGRTTINPFVSGVLGNWRPLKNWVFATTLNHEEHLRNSGTYNNFSSFFTNSFPLRKAARVDESNWKEKSMLTIVDVFGRAIESKDALGNYSAELYGYGFSLPTATATNAQHGEIAFDGFEDYNFRNQPSNPFNSCPLPAHFKPTEFEACDATVSHTGMYSLVVNSGTSVTRKYAKHYDFPIASTSLNQYNANNSVVISPFSPTPDKDFFLSVWVKKTAEEGTSSDGRSLLQQLGKDILPGGGVSLPGIGSGVGSIIPSVTQSDVVVTARNSTGTSYNIGSFKAEGNAVDGWYQVNGKFRVPPDAVSINVEMKALNGKTWFDDLRIQPFNSVMKTFVYHPQTLRLMATLDENNYATIYVYDQQEQLVATKKETESGIFTVQEVRNGTSKISKP